MFESSSVDVTPTTLISRRPTIVPAHSGLVEAPGWKVLARRTDYPTGDIDEMRAKYGQEEGETRFFRENRPSGGRMWSGNLVMGNGVSALWQMAMGLGSASANSSLGAGPTYYNNAQTRLYVGDGGVATGVGTVSIANGGTALTFGTSQSSLQGKYWFHSADTTNTFYTIVSGATTSWVITPVYGGTTLSTNAGAWYTMTAESHSQTALLGSTNTANIGMDTSYPSNTTTSQLNVITAATNATPIVLTTSGGDIASGDLIQVYEINGNTAANGMWVATTTTNATTITLLGSVGNSAYTYGGLATKLSVIKFSGTFGPTAANFRWLEWAIFNGTGGAQIMMNRKSFQGGTKLGGNSQLLVAIGIG